MFASILLTVLVICVIALATNHTTNSRQIRTASKVIAEATMVAVAVLTFGYIVYEIWT